METGGFIIAIYHARWNTSKRNLLEVFVELLFFSRGRLNIKIITTFMFHHVVQRRPPMVPMRMWSAKEEE